MKRPIETTTASTASITNEGGEGTPTGTTWTPPLWLMSMADSRHTARLAAVGSRSQATPMFRLAVGSNTVVESAVYDRILQQQTNQSKRSRSSQSQHASRKNNWRSEQLALDQLEAEVEECKQAIEDCEERRQQALLDIESLRKEELEKEINRVEEQAESALQSTIVERKRQFEESMEEKFAAERKQLQDDHNERREQRIKKQEEEEQQKQGTESVPEVSNLESEKLKESIQAFQTEIDEWNEQRTEMIWLLKQVIKAEEKQKAKVNQGDQKHEPRIHTSKQA